MRLRPPVVAGLWLLAGIALQRAVPAAPRLRGPTRWAGLIPVGAGLLLVAWALGLFRRRGTTFEPFGRPAALVTDGPYRFSRNPMYLALLLVLLGCAVLAGSALTFTAPVGFLLAMNATQIPREEAALEAAFGPAYLAYRRRVRRWL